MEAREVGLTLIDVRGADNDDLNKLIGLYHNLGYYVDISTTFEEAAGALGTKYVTESYTLLIYKEQPHD